MSGWVQTPSLLRQGGGIMGVGAEQGGSSGGRNSLCLEVKMAEKYHWPPLEIGERVWEMSWLP